MLCSMSQLINVLCAKCLLRWQCHRSLALAGNTAVCKMFCCAAWRSSSLDLWAGRTHQEHTQVPDAWALKGRERSLYDNKCLPLPSAGDSTDYSAVCCRWQMEVVITAKRAFAFKEDSFSCCLAIPYT